MQTFDTSALKPFYPAPAESTLANVGLHLPASRRATARQTRRTTAMLRKARAALDTLDHLPEPDESIHCVLNGSFALFDFIEAALQLSGEPIDQLFVATLGFSKKNVESIDELVTTGQLRRLDVLCSHYFAASDAAIYAQAAALCGRHGFRIAAMRTHAKILLIATGQHRLVIESSANLRSCHNVEQATLFNDRELYDFHRGWLDELLAKGAEA